MAKLRMGAYDREKVKAQMIRPGAWFMNIQMPTKGSLNRTLSFVSAIPAADLHSAFSGTLISARFSYKLGNARISSFALSSLLIIRSG